MEEKNIQIKQWAVRYFEGTVSGEEEKQLYAFIKASPENRALFESWEEEWLAVQDEAYREQAWLRLEKLLKTRLYLREAAPKKRRQIWIGKPFWHYVAAAVLTAVIWTGLHYIIEGRQNTPEYYTIETANGERSKVTLADGTRVWLNAGSKLTYSNHFNRKNREVELTGEAYFEVNKQPDETTFRVKTAGYDVVVKGTKFNVTSYADEQTTTTTLLEGKVEVEYRDQCLNIVPGEEVALNKMSGEISRYKTNTEQSKSWITGDLVYDSISLEELAKRLSRRYNVHIRLDDALDKTEEFKVTLQNKESIESVLNALSRIMPVRYQRGQDSILIRKR